VSGCNHHPASSLPEEAVSSKKCMRQGTDHKVAAFWDFLSWQPGSECPARAGRARSLHALESRATNPPEATDSELLDWQGVSDFDQFISCISPHPNPFAQIDRGGETNCPPQGPLQGASRQSLML